jgi:hypothetical protein
MLTEQSKPKTNRRSAIRKPPKGKTTLECYAGFGGMGPNIGLLVWDISQTGACIITKTAPVKRGDDLDIRLASNGLPRPMKLKATVAWVEPLDAHRLSVGIQFNRAMSYLDFTKLT